jgi:hypothetical protein
MNRQPDPVLQAALRQHLLGRVADSRTVHSNRTPTTHRPGFRATVTACVLVAVTVASFFTIHAAQQASLGASPAGDSTPTPRSTAGRAQFRGLITTATGTLTGAVTGTVRLTSKPDAGFTIKIDTSRVDGLKMRHVELATSLQDVDCQTENDTDRSRVIDFGATDVSGPVTLQRPPFDGNDFGDLSFMTVLVLTPNDGSSNDDYCTPSKMGVARLTWQRPAAYRELRAVDHGRTEGAQGTLQLFRGRPEAYTVAPNDQLTEVARRFGLTAEQVLYLNPRRRHGTDPKLYVDETLNLDPDNR